MRREDRTWTRALFKEFHPAPKAGAFEEWLDYVTQVDVELRPNGRAILTHPELKQLWVELRWDATGVISALIEGPPGESLPRVEVCVSPFLAALELRRRAAARDPALITGAGSFSAASPSLSGKGAVSVPLPAAGKPPSLPFYRQILAEDAALRADGVKAPVSELARRHGANRDTVKSWLRRGGEYQRKGKL